MVIVGEKYRHITAGGIVEILDPFVVEHPSGMPHILYKGVEDLQLFIRRPASFKERYVQVTERYVQVTGSKSDG